MQFSNQVRRRFVAASAVAVTLVSVAVISSPANPASAAPTAPSTASPTPPPNPSNQQLSNAASQKAQVAQQIGVLNGTIAAARIKLQNVQDNLELAKAKVVLDISNERLAETAATKARKNASRVSRKVIAAHTGYVDYIQAQYYGQGIGGTASSLLSAKDPSDVLRQSTLAQYEATTKLHAVDDMQTALVAKQNADTLAQKAQTKAAKASMTAKSAESAIAGKFRNAQTTTANLDASLATSQQELVQKQSYQATLLGQRKTYNAYVAEQARIAAEKARLARIAAEKARLARIAAEKAEKARLARMARQAKLARQRAQQSGNNSGSGGGNHSGSSHRSSPISSGPSAPNGGWTAYKGRQAVLRARSTLGIIYAWAGGNQYGPTRGVCAGDGAFNDCNVTGYDCSGLAMYAWGQGWVHYAATQYTEAGSYHPSLGNLAPGDLLFWSTNGTIGGIHHVAIYIGNGEIIQAPESGSVIQVSSMYAPGSIFGATRPLT